MKELHGQLKFENQYAITFFYSKTLKRDIEIILYDTIYEDEIGEKQIQTIQEIINNEEKLFSNALEAIVEFYYSFYDLHINDLKGLINKEKKNLEEKERLEKYLSKYYPKKMSHEKVMELLESPSFCINGENVCEVGTFTLDFETEWIDEEIISLAFKKWEFKGFGHFTWYKKDYKKSFNRFVKKTEKLLWWIS